MRTISLKKAMRNEKLDKLNKYFVEQLKKRQKTIASKEVNREQASSDVWCSEQAIVHDKKLFAIETSIVKVKLDSSVMCFYVLQQNNSAFGNSILENTCVKFSYKKSCT